jgi:intein-encoded DNA endonuclease-like protein
MEGFIEESPERIAKFLQGLFDAEGSISKRKLKLHNTDRALLHYAQRLLNKLGIEATGPHLSQKAGTKRVTKAGEVINVNKDCFYIYVRVESLQAFCEKIGFRIPRKRRKLEVALGIA